MLYRIIIYFYRRIRYNEQIEDSMRRNDDYEYLYYRHLRKFLHNSKKDIRIFATYDDHDMGKDDIGTDYKFKHDSKKQFAQFWGKVTGRSIERPDGIYEDAFFSVENFRIHVIMVDTRFSRSAWAPIALKFTIIKLIRLAFHFFQQFFFKSFSQREFSKICEPEHPRGFIDDPPHILAESQWQWLQHRLQNVQSDLIIVGSSIQVSRINPNDGSETWGLIPQERARLLRLLENTQKRVLILSGDVHYGEIAQISPNIIEATSSGLSETWPCAHYNQLRLYPPFHQTNFGLIDLYHNGSIHIQIRNSSASIVLQHFLPSLSPTVPVEEQSLCYSRDTEEQ
mmetsp:Transcript_18955/g.28607  ORF Transcript_18955/g.28607 Transcript_18955/m.28607 type:complete len:339 (-) Transcript_18955:216-1232(-)